MFGKVYETKEDNDYTRIDHYLRLNIDNSEIIKMIKNTNSSNELINKIIIKIDYLEEFCIPTRSLKYTDKNGIYWDNFIE